MELETLVRTLEKKLDRALEQIDKLVQILIGDSTDITKPGVMIRLDRLERSDRNKTKIIWALATGMVAVCGKTLLSLI